MILTEKFYKLVTDDIEGKGFIPKDNISKEQKEELIKLNKDYKKFYGIDIIYFDKIV